MGSRVSSKVSVILPAYGESENLQRLVPKLLEIPEVSECVVVIDPKAGEDSGAAALRKWNNVQIIENETRIGLARSILRGISAANEERVLVRDSDFNHDLALTSELARHPASFVVASRYVAGELRIGRWLDVFSYILNQALHWRWRKITDFTLGYFAIEKKRLKEKAWVFRGRGEYMVRLIRVCGGDDVAEVSAHVQQRGHGHSTTALIRHGWPYLWALVEPMRTTAEDLFNRLARKHQSAPAGSGHTKLGWNTRRKILRHLGEPERGIWWDQGCGNGAFAKTWRGSDQLSLWGVDRAEGAREVAASSEVYQWITEELPRRVNLRGLALFECAQYASLEEIKSWILHAKSLGAREVLVIAPHRKGLIHRLRKMLVPHHPDYSTSHGYEDFQSTLEGCGFTTVKVVGASHFGNLKDGEPGKLSSLWGLRAELLPVKLHGEHPSGFSGGFE